MPLLRDRARERGEARGRRLLLDRGAGIALACRSRRRAGAVPSRGVGGYWACAWHRRSFSILCRLGVVSTERPEQPRSLGASLGQTVTSATEAEMAWACGCLLRCRRWMFGEEVSEERETDRERKTILTRRRLFDRLRGEQPTERLDRQLLAAPPPGSRLVSSGSPQVVDPAQTGQVGGAHPRSTSHRRLVRASRVVLLRAGAPRGVSRRWRARCASRRRARS